MNMTYSIFIFVLLKALLCSVICEFKIQNITVTKNDCNVECAPGNDVACGFEPKTVKYRLFANRCTMNAYGKCHNIAFFETEINFCIRDQIHENKRRMYGESCPVFCPSHYRPVCGANKLRSYLYRTFNNGCYLDMVNCRGSEDSGFVEVSLEFCQNHLMKNIFKENIIVSHMEDYRDYHEY